MLSGRLVPTVTPAGVSTRNPEGPSRSDTRMLWNADSASSWPASAPTWKACPRKLPSSSRVPLNSVCVATLSISRFSCCASASSAARSPGLLVALTACTASSRIRCRLLPTSANAPSAVCASEIPSLALRTATFRPRICVLKRSEIARPAASSLALLMRSPDERRCNDVPSAFCELPRFRCAFSDSTLVLITCDIYSRFVVLSRNLPPGAFSFSACRPSMPPWIRAECRRCPPAAGTGKRRCSGTA